MRRREAIGYVVAVLFGAGVLALGCLFAYQSVDGSRGIVGPIAVVGALLTFGVGLIARWYWARKVAATLCLLVAIILPIGIVNPFAAMDVAQPPTLSEVLIWLVPAVLGLLGLAWLIDPPKRRQPEISPKG